MSCIRESYEIKGYSDKVIDILMASWRSSTKKQYDVYYKKWNIFCVDTHTDPVSPSIQNILDFLSGLYHAGLGYSALNTAKSALSSLIHLSGQVPLGNHPLICRFMRGVFQQRPSLPRYTEIWDVNIVLSYLRKLSPVESLSLKDLTLKLTMLLTLLSGQRVQTIHLLDLSSMTINNSSCTFVITEKVKQTRPGKHVQPLKFTAYAPDKRLCVIKYLQEYLKRTNMHRGHNNQLLLSFVKPFKPVSKDTVSRWVKTVLKDSGINTQSFHPHSVRSASTSAAQKSGLPLSDIMKAAGWSNVKTFATYYHKSVVVSKTFGEAIVN